MNGRTAASFWGKKAALDAAYQQRLGEADDIAYAIHDLEDFHRVGVLQQAGVKPPITLGMSAT